MAAHGRDDDPKKKDLSREQFEESSEDVIDPGRATGTNESANEF